jgi:hypothetical protein
MEPQLGARPLRRSSLAHRHFYTGNVMTTHFWPIYRVRNRVRPKEDRLTRAEYP